MMSDKQSNGMFDVSQELNAGYTFTKTQLAELESLRAQITELTRTNLEQAAQLEMLTH